MNATATTSADELRNVVARAEKLIATLENSGEDAIVKLRARASQAVAAAKDRLQNLQSSAVDSVRGAAKATDDYVHENPWQTLACGVAFGLFVGALLARRV